MFSKPTKFFSEVNFLSSVDVIFSKNFEKFFDQNLAQLPPFFFGTRDTKSRTTLPQICKISHNSPPFWGGADQNLAQVSPQKI